MLIAIFEAIFAMPYILQKCIRFFAVLLLIAFGTKFVYAADTYDSRTNTLTIPIVKAYGYYYKNVVITVGNVLSVGGALPIGGLDSYDYVNNVLSIAEVNVDNKKYNNVSVLVDKVISVAGRINLDVSLKSLLDLGTVDSKAIEPLTNLNGGWWILLAAGDLNGDGHDDLLIGPNTHDGELDVGKQPGDERVPRFTEPMSLIVLFYDPKNKKFMPDSALQARIPKMQYAHRGYIGDFNNDGYADFMVAGTGPDQGEPCGEAPVLMLGSKSGLYDKSELLPRFSMYAHQEAVGDFNNDGVTDFFFINNAWVPTEGASKERLSKCAYRKYPGTNKSFLVLSKNGGGWESSTPQIDLNYNGLSLNNPYNESGGFSGADARDFDGDGNIDILIGGIVDNSSAGMIFILSGDGKGGFKSHSNIRVANFEASAGLSTVRFSKMIDRSNLSVISAVSNSKNWSGATYRVYDYDVGSKSWKDNTAKFFPTSDLAGGRNLDSCFKIIIVDFNMDGLDDLVCNHLLPFNSDDPSAINPRLWLQTNEGIYLPVFHQGFVLAPYSGSKAFLNRFAGAMPAKIDGKWVLLGFGMQGFYEPSMSILGMTH